MTRQPLAPASRRWLASAAACFAAFSLSAGDVSAAVITQWNFNTTIAVNNSPAPSTGAGVASIVGMTNNAPNGDILAPSAAAIAANNVSSDPAVSPDNMWRVRGSVSNGWSGTVSLLSGARFNVSTAGVTGVVVSMDLFATDGSPRHAQFQYTTDGTTFTSFGPLLDFNATSDAWANGIVRDLSSVAAVDNNPAFGFRVVSAFSPVAFTNASGSQAANTAFQRTDAGTGVYTGGAGNYRFDVVTVSGEVIPEPSTAAVAAMGLLTLVARRVRA
ncbi:MAG: hypothetical protein ACRCT8_01715 [Lacipirellulaceae bacterium]